MNKTILIVEDDAITSELLKRYLSDLNYNLVGIASTGEEAARFVEKKKTDLILMDITLEGDMDGIEAVRRINRNHDIPVIYITSSDDNETIERARLSNPFGFIIKPIDKNELKTHIDMAFHRYAMEKKLRESEQKLSTILNSIADGVIVTDSNGIVTYMNPVAEAMTECSMADNNRRKLSDIVHIENMAIKSLRSNTAVDSDQRQLFNYLLTKSGNRIPVDYSVAPQKDADGNFVGTVMVIRDITERVLSEDRAMESIIQLRKGMGGMIQAIASTIESRDPYTAGHQRRVSNLARELAKVLGLPKSIIEGVRMAGVIHDLGKISVPAEILSKPGKLNEIEYSLIKIHPQIGFEILKPIDFPWPVADIIYQHHERIDGSGYPRGLSGDEIMIEARILTVADVVEAMASHRPYRASLGIECALAEIEKNKGILYDADVVDACRHVLQEDEFIMDQVPSQSAS